MHLTRKFIIELTKLSEATRWINTYVQFSECGYFENILLIKFCVLAFGMLGRVCLLYTIIIAGLAASSRDFRAYIFYCQCVVIIHC